MNTLTMQSIFVNGQLWLLASDVTKALTDSSNSFDVDIQLISPLEAIQNYLSRSERPKTAREIINSLRHTKPFLNYSDNKINAIREAIDDAVTEGHIVKIGEGYSLPS